MVVQKKTALLLLLFFAGVFVPVSYAEDNGGGATTAADPALLDENATNVSMLPTLDESDGTASCGICTATNNTDTVVDVDVKVEGVLFACRELEGVLRGQTNPLSGQFCSYYQETAATTCCASLRLANSGVGGGTVWPTLLVVSLAGVLRASL